MSQSQKGLIVIVLCNVLSTAIHYWDNYVHFDAYPVPPWITPDRVWLAWVSLTMAGLIGLWLYGRQNYWLAYACLAVYALTGASTLGHYFYAPFSYFSAAMNAMILSDGVVGYSLLGFVLWSALLNRPWQTESL